MTAQIPGLTGDQISALEMLAGCPDGCTEAALKANGFTFGLLGGLIRAGYLSRYTHRVAISNRRLIAADAKAVTFKVKDYRIDGPGRYKTMTLDAHEFIRRFLIHVLPKGFHRIRHYGLLASGVKADNLVLARKLLDAAPPEPEDATADPAAPVEPCPCCGSTMRIIEVFKAGESPRHRPTAMPAAIRIDTS